NPTHRVTRSVSRAASITRASLSTEAPAMRMDDSEAGDRRRKARRVPESEMTSLDAAISDLWRFGVNADDGSRLQENIARLLTARKDQLRGSAQHDMGLIVQGSKDMYRQLDDLFFSVFMSCHHMEKKHGFDSWGATFSLGIVHRSKQHVS